MGETAKLNSYLYNKDFRITHDIKGTFNREGYVILRNLLDGEEVDKLRTNIEQDPIRQEYSFRRSDGDGLTTAQLAWNHPGDDITGMIARSEKVAGTLEELLGGELYHYHTKLSLKEAGTGGAFCWHQDYGYWYENGCLWPDMGTVLIAIDEADKSNGCLKIIPGSNRCGRIQHEPFGEQVQANTERLNEIIKVLGVRDIEMQPGDAIFTHCNLLHRSDQNKSEKRRWAFLVAYNRATNNPVKIHHHPQYTPMTKVPNSAIKDCKSGTILEGKDYFKGDSQNEFDSLKKTQESN